MPTAVATTATGLLPRPVTPRRTSRRGVSEDRLIAGLRRRDPDALAQAHRDYGGAVLGCLRRMIGDPGGAEDVHQEVFLEVWQRGPTYDPRRSSPATWVMTIARSRAIDHLRRRVPEPRDPAGALALAEREAPPDIDALHDRWWVAAVLAELPDAEAEVLRMRFERGLNQAEIAEALDVPLGTVKTRMYRGLQRLRAEVEAAR